MLEPLLEVADSLMTYRRRYFARPQVTLVLDLLIADQTNARALAFQIDALAAHVQRLPRDPKAPSPTREEQLIASIAVEVREADLERLSRPNAVGNYAALAELLASLNDGLLAMSDTITRFYFAHGEPRVS